ncbi:chaperone protein dnaJ 20, chloroplastic-like [Syzygium oleosum]|uniref:chaperone protein dnaJ 20, chloroplastic-like n=1 Tax=Syzygium oleosum TaxID=219896 RepID=UPI0011D1CE22|nr:chaperone protein dnaJ 20, chloroplastic-like [Syzygium oleosum]
MAISLTSALKTSQLSLSPSHSLFTTQRPRPRIAISCQSSSSSSATRSVRENGSNYYELLSLNPSNTSADDVKRAYRSLARQYHPDACRDPSMKEESTRMFLRLHEAYETLSDPRSRQVYNCELGLSSTVSWTSPCSAVDGNSLFTSDDQEMLRSRWQDQIVELKRRSNNRMAQKNGSWAAQKRAHNLRRD